MKINTDQCFFLAKKTDVLYAVTMKMTPRKQEILDIMWKFQSKEGYPPTVREICKSLGLASAGSLLKHLRSLEEAGFIEHTSGRKRAWKLLGRPPHLSIPLVGRIAAGAPILAEENREGELSIDPSLFGSGEAFALRVKGDSMIEAHIRDGDLAIIRPQNDAEDGLVVAVQVDDLEPEATLKILRKDSTKIELRPANANYEPLVFKGKERSRVRILGKMVGLIRPKL